VTITTASEIVSRFSTSDPRSADQDAHLLGVEQGLALAADIVKTARSRREAEWDTVVAERAAGGLRRSGRAGRVHIIDEIRREVTDARAIRRRRA
jgi:hypothetical protein